MAAFLYQSSFLLAEVLLQQALESLAVRLPSLCQQAIDEAHQHQHIIFIQTPHPLQCLLDKLRVLRGCIKELLRCDLEVITNSEKFFQGRKRLSGRNVIHVPPTVSQVIAHLIFGYALFQPKLCNTFSYKILIHPVITSKE